MSIIERCHGEYVHTRRVHVLSSHLAKLIPQDASVLDVGCGDGLIAHLITQERPDVQMEGIDVLQRDETYIPVQPFDGSVFPYEANSFDVVMFVDVLHHTDDPMILLREAVRVARQVVLIKDHTRNGLLAGSTLRFMDRVGNARYGVALPYNYWPRQRWHQAFTSLDLTIGAWRDHLGLYPAPANLLFERSLHFIAQLKVSRTKSETGNSATATQ